MLCSVVFQCFFREQMLKLWRDVIADKMRSGTSSDLYRDNWSVIVKLLQVDKTHCIHHGLYEKGVFGHVSAVRHMNDFVGCLLGLDMQQCGIKKVLDAGCGVGGVSIYLAQKYPDVRVVGITNVVEQVRMAEGLAQEEGVGASTEFLVGDFCDSGFSSNGFDGVFLVESLGYVADQMRLVREMYRVLKPGGTLVVIDVFRTPVQLHGFLLMLYDCFCKCWGLSGVWRLEELVGILKEEGFCDIGIRDLTGNVVLGIVRGSVFGVPYLVSLMGSKVVRGKSFSMGEDPRFVAVESFFCMMLGIAKGITYTAVTATKPL
ncbi:MAG: methyltransferase domain-containing protein [Candidatus Thermoplasmatota archaeon]|nr:methyltransferase domain-containing protein [Candidatus Thermoplasmatota archaeon]MBU1940465.1 methyltransferase domain-containing protein [Candidatus Thermoplasmatota archaeon]